jgi:type II restriction enzyme
MNNMSSNAIQAVNNGLLAYCKFLSANDTGYTGGHQAGIYIAKNAMPILFAGAGEKGTNK